MPDPRQIPGTVDAHVGPELSPPVFVEINIERLKDVVELMDHAMHPDIEYESDHSAMADAAIIKMKKLIFNARETLTAGGWFKEEPNTEPQLTADRPAGRSSAGGDC